MNCAYLIPPYHLTPKKIEGFCRGISRPTNPENALHARSSFGRPEGYAMTSHRGESRTTFMQRAGSRAPEHAAPTITATIVYDSTDAISGKLRPRDPVEVWVSPAFTRCAPPGSKRRGTCRGIGFNVTTELVGDSAA